ncbi:MAG: family metallopeptidase [Ferruginibacter sp.]|jgi:predicted Zn-dependent protease|uniref:M48 family metallopeptidase n=1 Tax=Ferruginibacter sp. TaxID=1940288 RepID=UPI00265A1720|nr:M48 family metallopeptidase [Ferruginibacter sp.]MDB5277590.1 family metallopeptidase [Ferruginibacter sp.]
MKKIIFLLVATSVFAACSRNAVTGRRQLSLLPESQLQEMALTEYKTFLSQNKVVSTGASKDAEMVRRVGSRIASAITEYYTKQGKGDVLSGYNWEFNLVDNKEVNAWCMPGGKVVVYTGLLPVTQNEAALAIVLGHEITHAVARHGNERMSQEMLTQGLGSLVNVATANNPKVNSIFNTVYGPGSQLGYSLPNSRSQEYEADHFGLIFAAMAGYNPREAVTFWERMAAASGGQKPPELLSTHPADANRIEKIKGFMNEALSYYKPVK